MLSRVWELEQLRVLDVSVTAVDDTLFEALREARHPVLLKQVSATVLFVYSFLQTHSLTHSFTRPHTHIHTRTYSHA